MALDLTGIENDNEFYSSHYLAAIFESDLKHTFRQWQEQEERYREQIRASGQKADPRHPDRAPWVRLKALAQDYFRLQNQLQKEHDPACRLALQRGFTTQLLDALHYPGQSALKSLDNHAGEIPVLAEVAQGLQPVLWVLMALNPPADKVDPLTLTLQARQWPEDQVPEAALLELSFEDLLGKHIFAMDRPPRWILLISDNRILLIDRSKWHEKRLLRFDLGELFGRREDSTLKASAALLAREHLAPEQGLCLIDTLDENAHKHAFAVSEDLKYALRECIELLGNEAIRHWREVSKEAPPADNLSRECLRYMYRLLFLFYIEARPELAYVPVRNSPAYLKGYSLEALRDLEMVPLHSEEARGGSYINDSIQLLFDLIYQGFQPGVNQDLFASGDAEAFSITPLKSHLFDPASTPTLNRVRFRNEVLQKIIRLMSLSRPARGRTRRGRISYAQLGINQLGAVYEALLSYQGFFAPHDLYEVKKAGSNPDDLESACFVPESELGQYTEQERVLNEQGGFKCYPRGTFIYRMNGRDREKSASYYTPEVLTRTLVKYALKELLKDKSAALILQLQVCEPAMGSAAFLNEAINQLAAAYIRRREQETGQRLAHEAYAGELQKIKLYLADNNVFGIDLNPVAVELAEVSLWLNSIHESGFVPWFGLQLFNGNSLIGARRQVFGADVLDGGNKKDQLWYNLAPLRLDPLGLSGKHPQPDEGEQARTCHDNQPLLRQRGRCVYHFLLPDPGMAHYQDKVVKKLEAARIKRIADWRKAFCRPFTEPEIRQLQVFSGKIDQLWQAHASQQRAIRNKTTDPFAIWGHAGDGSRRSSGIAQKDRILQQERESRNLKNSSPYRRLKLVMDYWCALWFWPIQEAENLPARDDWLFDLNWLLMGGTLEPVTAPGQTAELFPDTLPRQQSLDFNDRFGQLDVDKIIRDNQRLRIADRLARLHRFFHWELEFADIFALRGGFDLVLGNPPWLKVEWQEAGVLGDANPLFVLRRFSASQLDNLRGESFLQYPGLEADYLLEYQQAEGTQNFLNATVNYPLLKGVQTNLYKCFLPQAWQAGNRGAVSGFLHPEGVYDDPRGGPFRAAIYPRLRGHYQFQNEKKLFSEVANRATFSINIHGAVREVSFKNIANLFIPLTIDACYQHDGQGAVGGIKNDEDEWNFAGHHSRIIPVNEKILQLFARLYDAPGTPALQARLPALHSRQLVTVLEKFAAQPRRLGDLQGEYFSLEMWHETNSQKDGTIRRQTGFPEHAGQWILSGPHFFVGTPFYQTPRAICETHKAYDNLDITALPDDYLPRGNYVPACGREEYQRRVPRVSWIEQGETQPKRVTEYYRFVNREMIGSSSERTFINGVLPKGVAHINTCLTLVFKETNQLLDYSALCLSIPIDFRVKSTGQSHANLSLLNQLPVLTRDRLKSFLHVRALGLNCLTSHFADLWQACYQPEFNKDHWAKADPRLPDDFFHRLTPDWQRHCALRSDYLRHQGAAGDRCAGGAGPGPDAGGTADPLPRAVSGDAPVRAGHLVRPRRPHRVHRFQGPGGRRSAAQGEKGRPALPAPYPAAGGRVPLAGLVRGKCQWGKRPVSHRYRWLARRKPGLGLGRGAGSRCRRRRADGTGRYPARWSRATGDPVCRAVRPL